MIAARKQVRWIASAALLLATLAGIHGEAAAYLANPAAITGRTNKNGGGGCGDAVGCHTGNAKDAVVSITGPASLKPGQLGTYTVRATKASVGSGVKMGMAVAASDGGTPLSETKPNLVVASNEVVHSSTNGALNTTNGSGSATYEFNYTMPAGAAVGSVHTLYAVARLGNAGGTWNHASNFTVTAAGTAPAITSPPPPSTGSVGTPYTHTYAATGNPAPTFAVSAGALPNGVALNASTGAVTGTPTVAGTFTGTVRAANGVSPAATQAFTIVIGATRNFQGLWWANPPGSEAGWGINFAHQGDTIFATWFTYGADGNPTWFIVLFDKTGDGAYAGPVSRVTGPPFYAVPFDPAQVAETIIGSATLTFAADGASATFAYTVNGISQVKQIVRQEYATPVPSCTWGAQANLAAATNYQDLWWRSPAGFESGWGINFTQQGNVIFATWFTYGPDGKPTWFIVLADRQPGNVFVGPISTVTGPPFNAVPFDPALVAETVVGSATISFADGNSATLDYTIGAVQQVKPIVRQVFVPPGTLCQ